MEFRALVFEDNDQIRNIVIEFLERNGFEVYSFSEAGSCPLFLEKKCPCPSKHACVDVILADINMPGITGLEFIDNQVKKGCKVKNIGVMSGAWNNNQIEQANKLKVHIIHKPFKMKDFVSWLEDCKSKIDPERVLSNWFTDKI